MLTRVIAEYRWFDGASFDHDYYATTHMLITREAAQGFGLVRLESERVNHPAAPGNGQVVAVTSAWFRDLASAHNALDAIGPVLQADLAHYTSIRPDMRISQVRTHLDR